MYLIPAVFVASDSCSPRRIVGVFFEAILRSIAELLADGILCEVEEISRGQNCYEEVCAC
jgi:hypothetical protein